jgi:hypothetical protein
MRFRQLRPFQVKPVLFLSVVAAVGFWCWLTVSDYGLQADFGRTVVNVDVDRKQDTIKPQISSVSSYVKTTSSSLVAQQSHAPVTKPVEIEPGAIEEDVTNERGRN